MRQGQDLVAVNLLIMRHVARDHDKRTSTRPRKVWISSTSGTSRAASMKSSKARGSVLSSVIRKRHLDRIAQSGPVDHRALALYDPVIGQLPAAARRCAASGQQLRQIGAVQGRIDLQLAQNARSSSSSMKYPLIRNLTNDNLHSSQNTHLCNLTTRTTRICSARQPNKGHAPCAFIMIAIATLT